MSSDSEDVDVSFASQEVMADNLAIDVVNFEAGVVRLDSTFELGRARNEYVLCSHNVISIDSAIGRVDRDKHDDQRIPCLCRCG